MGDKSALCVSWGHIHTTSSAKGSCKCTGKTGCFCSPWSPVPCVRVMALTLLQDFRNVTQLMTRKSFAKGYVMFPSSPICPIASCGSDWVEPFSWLVCHSCDLVETLRGVGIAIIIEILIRDQGSTLPNTEGKCSIP